MSTLTSPAGHLDRSFGTDGTTILEGSDVKAIAALKAAGPHQGKIIGVLADGNDFKLFRLEKNGLLDTSFGTGGYLRWGFAGSPVRSTPTGITELSADKLLVTGYVQEGSPATFYYPAVARFNAGGSIDLLFGNDGVYVFKQPLPTAQPSSAVTPQQTSDVASVCAVDANDERILLAFNSGTLRPYAHQGLLIQLTPAGQLDKRFNQQGYVFFQFDAQNTASVGLAVRQNGNFIVAGNAPNCAFLAAFTPTGQIDSSFGTDGFAVLAQAAGPVTLTQLLLQPDDKPVAVGWFSVASTRKGYVTRTLADGKPDSTFNNAQPLTIERPFQSLHLKSARLDAEQAIVVAGELNTRALGLVGRVTPQGVMDRTFGIDGLSDTGIDGILNYTNSMAIQEAGGIVVAGSKNPMAAVCRYHG